MHKLPATLLSLCTILLLVLALAGTASATLQLAVDLPETAAPGETVVGTVWIENASDGDPNVKSYSVHLTADSALGLTIKSTGYLDLGGFKSVESVFIASACMSGYHLIDPVKEQLFTFTFTIPSSATDGTPYTVDFIRTSEQTYLRTETIYYYDGSGNFGLPGALLTTVPDTITVAIPGLHTVTFYNETGTVYNTTTVLDGNKVARPADPVKTGHAFMGWNNTSASGPAYDFDAPVTTDLSLYANWSANSYTVTFYNETGTVYTTSSVTYGSTVAAPADPVKTGHAFMGWNRSSPSGPVYVFSTPVTADLSLYANWSANSYTVTFYNETGIVYTTSSVTYGSTVAAPADPVKTGYTFNGWNRSSPSGPAYVFSTPVTADLVLYANWSVNSYAITYINPSHGTVGGVSSATYGSTVTVTASPASGYQFSQLVVTKNGSSTTVSTAGTTFVMPAYDVNVTAVFSVAPTPVPTSGPSGGGGNKGASQIIPYTPVTDQVTVDITEQYVGVKFICLGTSAADIAAIRAIDPILAAALEAKIARAEAAGIRLTNNKGAPAIVSSDLKNPALDHVTFSKVYDISSANPSVKLTQVTVTVPKAMVAASGLTTDDVTIYHDLATYDIWVPLDTLQISEDTANYYYTAATDGTSPFGVLIKRVDDTQAVPTTNPTAKPVTGKSPAPVAGIIAGLGAAAILLRLKRR